PFGVISVIIRQQYMRYRHYFSLGTEQPDHADLSMTASRCLPTSLRIGSVCSYESTRTAPIARIFQRRVIVVGMKMVGAPGFEPGTSRTPSVRATRLRYAPTSEKAA